MDGLWGSGTSGTHSGCGGGGISVAPDRRMVKAAIIASVGFRTRNAIDGPSVPIARSLTRPPARCPFPSTGPLPRPRASSARRPHTPGRCTRPTRTPGGGGTSSGLACAFAVFAVRHSSRRRPPAVRHPFPTPIQPG